MYSIKHHLKTFVSYFRHFGTIRRVFLIQTDRHDIIEFFQSIYFTIDTVSKAYDASQGVLNRRFLLLNLWFPVVTLKLSLRKFYGRHHDLVNLDTMDTFSLLYSQFRPPFLFHDSSSRFNKDNTTDVSSTERTGYLSGTHESNLVFVMGFVLLGSVLWNIIRGFFLVFFFQPLYCPLLSLVKQKSHPLSVPHSWLITGFVTRISRRGAISVAGTAYHSGAPEFTPGFKWGLCYSIFSFMCIFLQIVVYHVGHCVICPSIHGF